MGEQTICICCDEPLSFRWCDTHGVGACIRCGMPYRIFHYEGPKHVEKPPECMIVPEWQVVGRRYWQETKSRVFPGEFDMGFMRGRSYSGASRDEHAAFWNWVHVRKDEMPKPKAEAAHSAAK